jgi:hypothetical protein
VRRVIDGKIYDTNNAEEIANWDNCRPANVFNYCDESLYRTKKGVFFLSGVGGPLSHWSRCDGGNERYGGSGMRVLSVEEARSWCEDHRVTAEVIEEYFKIEEG